MLGECLYGVHCNICKANRARHNFFVTLHMARKILYTGRKTK